VPPLTGRVVRCNRNTKRRAETAALEGRKLQNFEQRKGSQIVVLITGTTFPEPDRVLQHARCRSLEDRRKGVNDGLLIVLRNLTASCASKSATDWRG